MNERAKTLQRAITEAMLEAGEVGAPVAIQDHLAAALGALETLPAHTRKTRLVLDEADKALVAWRAWSLKRKSESAPLRRRRKL